MSLYFKSILIFIKSEFEYRASFIFSLLASALNTFFILASALILMDTFGGIGDWKINEIILLTGIASFGHSFVEMFGRGLDHFYKHIKNGLLDRLLVRPRNITFQVLCSNFEFYKIGRLIESVIFLIYGIITINVEWNIYKGVVILLMILGSLTLFFSIVLIKASFSFWAIEGMELMNIISNGGRDLSSYPIDIYQKWFAAFFTYVIPFGCVNYFPLLYLLDKGNPPFWYGLTPLVTVIFCGLCFMLWNFRLSQYKSTGS